MTLAIDVVCVVPLKSSDPSVRQRLAAGLSGLQLAPGQDAFVGEPRAMVEAALADPARHPFAILTERSGSADKAGEAACTVVGMGVLHVGAATAVGWQDAEGAVLLRGFLIDRGRQGQGQGHGTRATLAAVELAKELVSRLGAPATGVVLGVNERNVAGRAAYLKAGFVDRGQYLGGRSGPQRTLYCAFANHG